MARENTSTIGAALQWKYPDQVRTCVSKTTYATGEKSIIQWDADIDDAIDSGGGTTTYRFENPEGPNTRRLFFKVIEN